MDDDFVYALRQDPRPEFAHQLGARLRAADASAVRAAPRAARWLALAASLAAVSVAFTFPAVRAGAQAFLDLFRVSSFAGIAFDPQRLASLRSSTLDWPQIIGEQVEVITAPSAPVSYSTPDEAGAAAGIRLYEPTWLPRDLELQQTIVAGESAVRFTASTFKLKLLLDALDLRDVTIPEGVDGQQASVHVWPIVTQTYAKDGLVLTFVQSRSPEVSFPAGLDLPALAEIGLRILGLDRNEAYRFAQSIDWRSTLVVPVPVTAASFQEVNIQGHPGLLIRSSDPADHRPPNTVVLWSAGGNMYSLHSPMLPSEALIAVAQALQ
jgi:hypothetical protein